MSETSDQASRKLWVELGVEAALFLGIWALCWLWTGSVIYGLLLSLMLVGIGAGVWRFVFR